MTTESLEVANAELAGFVEAKLMVKWSPEQISDGLDDHFPDRPEMQVSHETIYQALFVQGRGHLRADLDKQLRTGRAIRRPHKESGPKPGYTDFLGRIGLQSV